MATMWALSLELHKATISVSPHCTKCGSFEHEKEGILTQKESFVFMFTTWSRIPSWFQNAARVMC